MATYKTLSGDYTISMGPYDQTDTQWLGVLTVNGNLNVLGNITSVSDIKVNDAFIQVAGNNTGTVQDMGLVATINTSTGSYAGLRYNALTSQWEISNQTYANGAPVGNTYQPIATTISAANAAGLNTQIQFNQGGVFGASSNLTFDYVNNALTVNGYEILGNINSTPATPSNAVAIYNSTIGGGGTGVYVLSSAVNDELVSKTKAIIYGIIF